VRVKRISNARKPEWPAEVKVGSVTAKIYRSVTRRRELFTVAYRDTNNRRVKKSFADFAAAKLEAQAAAIKIQNGQIDVLELTSDDRVAYQHAIGLLKPTGRSLQLAAAEYAEAIRILGGVGSIAEAARFFAHHHPVALPIRSIPQVYEEFLTAKTEDNASQRYLQDIRSRLGRLKKHFPFARIPEVTGKELEEWISSLGCGPVARNSVRALTITFFNFARHKGYLTRNRPTAADSIGEAKEPPSKIGIFRPEQMQDLLDASTGTIQLYLALGAFTGLRQAELMRLDWKEIKLGQKHIEVTAGKAKTAQRRIVPIQPNLRAWIMPHAQTSGTVFSGDPSRFLNRVTKVARGLKITWPHNGLRHSYASYRLEKCKSAAQVALEMGTSPAMVFRHYRELVTPADAKQWWSIVPKSRRDLILMPNVKGLRTVGAVARLASVSTN